MTDYVGITDAALIDEVRSDPAASDREAALLNRLADAIEELATLCAELDKVEAAHGANT